MLITPAAPVVSVVEPTCLADGSASIDNSDGDVIYIFDPVGPSVDGFGNISGAILGTMYTVTATANTCVSGSANFTIEEMLVNPDPIIFADLEFCELQSGSSTVNGIDLTSFEPSGQTGGVWNDGANDLLTLANGGNSGMASDDYNVVDVDNDGCLLYTSPSPRDRTRSRMPSSA